VVKDRWDHQDLQVVTAPTVRTATMAKMVETAKMVNQWAVEPEPEPAPRDKLVLPLVVLLQAHQTEPEPELEPEPVPVVPADTDPRLHKLMALPRHLMEHQNQKNIKNQLKNAQCNANPGHLVLTAEWVKKGRLVPKALQELRAPMVNEANVVWSVTKLVLARLANKDRKVPREMMASSTISMDPLDPRDHPVKMDPKARLVRPARTAIPDPKDPMAMWEKLANQDQLPNPVDPVHPAIKDHPAGTEAAIIVHHRERLPVTKSLLGFLSKIPFYRFLTLLLLTSSFRADRRFLL